MECLNASLVLWRIGSKNSSATTSRRGQTVKSYNEENSQLGHCAELKESCIILGLTEGLSAKFELALAVLTVSTLRQWLTTVLQVESSIQRTGTQY